MKSFDWVIIGGGAAGVFGAIRAKQAQKEASVLLLEKSNQLLSKVKISGGGRCNVTHHCFDPKALIENYPRGKKELLSVFYKFGPKDTFDWFTARGVLLKTEQDGRVFPVTDSSQTIIDCLVKEMKLQGVDFMMRTGVNDIEKLGDRLCVKLSSGESIQAKKVLLATGSAEKGFALAKALGHHIVSPVPSLFTFNVPSSPLLDLAGTSVSDVLVKVEKQQQRGPLLITHWGFSGPAVIKLSAFAALDLHACDYQAIVTINYLPERVATCKQEKALYPAKTLKSLKPAKFTENLWLRFLERTGLDSRLVLAKISDQNLDMLERMLTQDTFSIEGKTTYKQEFVTAGGIDLKEVDFRTMASKLCPCLYFAGEILNIDGITGGFNFQNAWSTSYLAGSS